MKIKFILVFLGAISLSISAQDCTTKLQTAQQLFESGQIEQIPGLLDSCLQNGFSPEQRIKAFQLLEQVYLFDYNQTKADSLMVEFLKDYPTYKIKRTDPVEFANQFKSYAILPLWAIGVTVGPGIPFIVVNERYSTYNMAQLESSYNPYSFGFSAGIVADRYVGRNLWFTLGGNYSLLNFKKKELFAGKEELNYSEKSKWVTSNISFNFGLGKSNFRPYGFVGGEVGFLQSATAEIRRSISSAGENSEIVRPFTDITKGRNSLNVWAFGGLGVQYLLPKGCIKAGLGYGYSFLTYVKPEFRYSDNNVVQFYHFIDDDVLLNRMFLNFSYSMVFYKIRKKAVDEN